MFEKTAQRTAWRKRIFAVKNDTDFNAAALELFAWQFKKCVPYRRLAEAKKCTPKTVKHWSEIPAAPQKLFKEAALYCHPLKSVATEFHTSGTTTGKPGKQRLRSIDIYNAACVEGGKRANLLQDTRAFHFLAPPPRQAPHSSLSAMFEFWREGWGNEDSHFWVEKNQLQLERLRRQLELATEPVALCGAAFSFVHWIDTFSQADPLTLPEGSWLLETGGFKGRSREIEKSEFYEALAYLFGVKTDSIWNEYGMCELSSQAYARGLNGLHRASPWARVLIVDPRTDREVPVGEIGLVRWIDLANVDSVLAIQTLDQAVRQEDGFYLIGRIAQTEPRGCSLTAETFQPALGSGEEIDLLAGVVPRARGVRRT
jgi:hypothetical protein